MERETAWFVESLSNRQARFLLRWLEEDESPREEKQSQLLQGLRDRSPINGPQSALAYAVDNGCPSQIGKLSEYIGLYPGEAVIDALIETRIANVGSPASVISELVTLFAESAAVYDRFRDRSGFSAAVARQTSNLGAMLYHGAQRAAARHQERR